MKKFVETFKALFGLYINRDRNLSCLLIHESGTCCFFFSLTYLGYHLYLVIFIFTINVLFMNVAGRCFPRRLLLVLFKKKNWIQSNLQALADLLVLQSRHGCHSSYFINFPSSFTTWRCQVLQGW